MRKNINYKAETPNSRNEFIKMIEQKVDVIVVDNTLLKKLAKEINENVSSGKTGKTMGTVGPLMILISGWTLVGLVCGAVVTLCGALSISSDSLKKYKIYAGKDNDNEDIAVFLEKCVDLKLDTIEYPDWVKSVDYKRKNKRISTK